MTSPEYISPNNQLEYIVKDKFDDIVAYLSNEFDDFGTYVDDYLDIQHPLLAQYIELLTNLLLRTHSFGDVRSSQEIDTAYSVATQAFHFAVKVGSKALDTDLPSVNIRGFYKAESDQERIDRVIFGAEAYLVDKECIDYLITSNIQNMDPTNSFPHIARCVAAITLYHIECGAKENFIQQQLADLEANL